MAELLEELVEINVEHYKEYHAQVQQKINLVVSNSERLGEEKAVESLESLRKIAGNYTSTSLAYSIANAYFRIKGIEGKDIKTTTYNLSPTYDWTSGRGKIIFI